MIRYDADLFENRDSLLHYARLAYLDLDSDALAITGVAAFIYDHNLAAQDTLPIVSTDEGAIMLLHAAEVGDLDALWFIKVLDHHHLWHHSIPDKVHEYYNISIY